MLRREKDSTGSTVRLCKAFGTVHPESRNSPLPKESMPPSPLLASQMCDNEQEPPALGTAGVPNKFISLLTGVVPPLVLCSCHIRGHQICNIVQMLVFVISSVGRTSERPLAIVGEQAPSFLCWITTF